MRKDAQRILSGEQISHRLLDREGIRIAAAACELLIRLVDDVDQVPDADVQSLVGQAALGVKFVDQIHIALRRILFIQIVSGDCQHQRRDIGRIIHDLAHGQRAHHGVHLELQIELFRRVEVERVNRILHLEAAEEAHGIVDDVLDRVVAEQADDAWSDGHLIRIDGHVDGLEQGADLDLQRVHGIVNDALNGKFVEDLTQTVGDQLLFGNDIDRTQNIADRDDLEHLARDAVAHCRIADQQLHCLEVLLRNAVEAEKFLDLHVLVGINRKHVDHADPRIVLILIIEQIGCIADIGNVVLPQRVEHRVDQIGHLDHVDAAHRVIVIAAEHDIAADAGHAVRHILFKDIACRHQIDGRDQPCGIADDVVHAQLLHIGSGLVGQPAEHDVSQLVFVEDLDEVSEIKCKQHVLAVKDQIVQGNRIEGSEPTVVEHVHSGDHIDGLHHIVDAQSRQQTVHTGEVLHGHTVEYDGEHRERLIRNGRSGIAVYDLVDKLNHVRGLQVHQLGGRIGVVVLVVDAGKHVVDRGRNVALKDVGGNSAQHGDHRVQRRILDFLDRGGRNVLTNAGFKTAERYQLMLQLRRKVFGIGVEHIDQLFDRDAVQHSVGVVDDLTDGEVKRVLDLLRDDLLIEDDVDGAQNVADVERIEHVGCSLVDGRVTEQLAYRILCSLEQRRVVYKVGCDLQQEHRGVLDFGFQQSAQRVYMILRIGIAVKEGIDLVGNGIRKDKGRGNSQYRQNSAIGIVRDVGDGQLLGICTDAGGQPGQIYQRIVQIAVDDGKQIAQRDLAEFVDVGKGADLIVSEGLIELFGDQAAGQIVLGDLEQIPYIYI